MAYLQYSSGICQPPPAPFIEVEVQYVTGGATYNMVALLDTGADYFYIPKAIPDRGGWLSRKQLEVVTPVGKSLRWVYPVKIRLAMMSAGFAVPCLEHDQEYAIIGGWILNKLVITLDGPRQRFEVQT